MLTVEADAGRVEERLRSGGLVCPFCGGVLAGWGFARVRVLRGVAGPVRVQGDAPVPARVTRAG